MFLITLVVFSSMAPQIVIGQNELKAELNFINYNLKNGLPSNETYDVFQDSKGYIWIATDNGVVKFDGKNFITFTTRNGLTDNTIFKISEDNLGRIWFMTFNRNLCYYQNKEFHPYQYNTQLNKALKDIRVNQVICSFHMSEEGVIQLGLVNFTQVTISPEGKTTIHPNIIGSNNLENDLFFFNSSSIKNLFNEVVPIADRFKNQNKFIIQTEKWGNIHIIKNKGETFYATQSGLFRKNKTLDYSHVLRTFNITGVTSDNEGGFWCSTLKHGVLYIPNPNIYVISQIDQATQNFKAIIPQGNQLVFPINKDGTDKFFYSDSSHSLLPYNHPINASLIPLDHKNRGIKFEERIYFENIASFTIGLVNTAAGRPTFFSNHGFVVTKKQTLKDFHLTDLTNYSLSTRSPYASWYSRKDRKLAIKKSNPRITNHASLIPYSIKILKIFRIKNGEILVGTTKGLYYLNEQSLEISKYPRTYKFSDFRIQDILQSRDGTLFFATKSEGIFIVRNNTEINILAKDGLSSNTVNKFTYDSTNNILYAGTNNGLTKLVQKDADKWTPIPVISKYDGLDSYDIRSLYLKDSTLFFTNNSGLHIVQQKYLNRISISPKLYLDHCKVNNETTNLNHIANLTHFQNNISFSFTGISLKTESDLVFNYQLFPNDSIWNESSNSQLNFNALKPGDYNLKVIAKDQFGNMSSPIELSFNIIPAFWMTWWFYLLIILIGLSVVYYISFKSIQIYKNQAKFQRSLKEMHVVSLQSKMNPHFIFNSLNSIQNYILKNERLKANEYLLEFSSLIRSILQNSEHTYISLLKELETLRMYVALEKKRIRKGFEYTEKIDPEIDLNQCTIPTLLIQPYIENAIWHGKVYTNPNGKIEVSISKQADSLAFEISDNGIGIENAERSKVRVKGYKSIGSEATKKRIQLLSELNNDITEVKISKKNSESEEFPGTKITFSVPYKETGDGEEI